MVMEKTKLLTFTVFALLLLNLGTLGFLLLSGPKGQHPHDGGPGHHGKPRPREIIIEKLRFDPQQVKEYDRLIRWHQDNIGRAEQQISEAKNDLYRLLNDEPIDDKKKDSLTATIAVAQKQIEGIHFRHFQDIKKLCRPDQLNDFGQLTHELSRMFSRPQKRPHE